MKTIKVASWLLIILTLQTFFLENLQSKLNFKKKSNRIKNKIFKKSHHLLYRTCETYSFLICEKDWNLNVFSWNFFYKVPVEHASTLETYVDCLIALDYVQRNAADILLYSGDCKSD